MNSTALLPLFFVAVLLLSPLARATTDTEIQDINSLYQHTQYAAALERVNALLEKKPDNAQARFLKGLILTGQHQNADAIEVFMRLNEDFPELAEPYNNLAVLYAQQGHYRQAERALETAIHINPNYAVAEENLGDIYAKMAGMAYAEVIRLDGKNATATARLALIKELLTQHSAASMENKLDAKPSDK